MPNFVFLVLFTVALIVLLTLWNTVRLRNARRGSVEDYDRYLQGAAAIPIATAPRDVGERLRLAWHWVQFLDGLNWDGSSPSPSSYVYTRLDDQSQPKLIVTEDGDDLVLAWSGTNTSRDRVANLRARPARAGPHHVHAGFRSAIAYNVLAVLQSPILLDRLRQRRHRTKRLTLVGHSLGAAVAMGVALALKNPDNGLAVDLLGRRGSSAVHAFLRAAVVSADTPVVVRAFASACPLWIRLDPDAVRRQRIDTSDTHTLLKEGDVVGVVSVYTFFPLPAPLLPPQWELLPVGTLTVLADEDWYGRTTEWLERHRAGRAIPLVYAAADGSAGLWHKQKLINHVALQRAATVMRDAQGRVRWPLHNLERYRDSLRACLTRTDDR